MRRIIAGLVVILAGVSVHCQTSGNQCSTSTCSSSGPNNGQEVKTCAEATTGAAGAAATELGSVSYGGTTCHWSGTNFASEEEACEVKLADWCNPPEDEDAGGGGPDGGRDAGAGRPVDGGRGAHDSGESDRDEPDSSEAGHHDAGKTPEDSGGSDTGKTPEASGGPVACTYAVTGANASSGGCQAVIAFGSSKLIFSLSATVAAYDLAFQVELGTTSALTTGTFTSSNVVESEASSAILTTGAAWAENFKNGSQPDQGTFSLTITSTGPEISASGGSAWETPHGSITVTLLPEPDSTAATGTLTATATF